MEQMDDKEKKKRQNDQLDNEWVEMMKKSKMYGAKCSRSTCFFFTRKKENFHSLRDREDF